MALLALNHLSRRFGALSAVNDVSLTVEQGEFFTLLGPSGCGKTTILRMIAGFDAPDAGEILLDGQPLAGVPPERRPLHTVFQSYALFPHMTVAGNVAFPLEMARLPDAEIRRRVGETLDLVHLADKARQFPHELSGGQKQRVALARGLVNKPRLLLLDEPLGALDRKLREETQFQLKEIQRKTRTSFVIVTHDQDEALALADRIAVMRAGRVEQIASPVDIYERPATRFVAGFVGETNFITGVVRRDHGAVFETAFGPLPRNDCALPEGARASLSIRPERIGVLRGGSGVAGRVEDFVFRGEYTLLRVRVAPDVALRVGAHEDRFAIGDEVTLAIASDAGVLFAEES